MIQAVAYIGEPTTLPLAQIETLAQIRTRNGFDQASLSELASSIKEVGVMQPLIVRRTGTESYALIAGERRLLAASMAGLAEVPVLIRPADEAEAATLQAIENLQRENLSLADTAQGVATLLAHWKKPAEVARRLGKSPAWVSKHLSMTRLSPSVKVLLLTGATEDMELLLCLDQIARTKGEAAESALVDLIDGIEAGTTTRAAARAVLSRLKGKGKASAVDADEGEDAGNGEGSATHDGAEKMGRLELSLDAAQELKRCLDTAHAPEALRNHVRDFINNVWGV